MPELHARLGPSNHRWPHCPGSVREEANYEDIAGPAAIDGTGSHLLLELCLNNAVRAESYIGQVIGVNHHDSPMGWMIDRDRADRVQICLDYVARRHGELSEQFPGSQILIESESKSDPGAICRRDDWWGTVDITITVLVNSKCVFIEVVDYKDGQGWVHVDHNTQLVSYLAGKMSAYTYNDAGRIMDARMINGCRATIIQPKTNPPIRYWDPQPQDIANEHHQLSLKAKATDDPEAPLIAGKHCKWCKHKKNCNAESMQSIERMKPMTTEVTTSDGLSLFQVVEQTFGDITTLEDEKLADLLDSEAGIKAAFDKVRDEIQSRLEQGRPVPGYAMKPGNSKQVWNDDEEEVVKKLKARRLKTSDIYPPKLITPAQVLKHPGLTNQQKKRIQEEMISVVEGKLTLKQVSREKKNDLTAEQMFAGVVEVTPVQEEQAPQEISFF